MVDLPRDYLVAAGSSLLTCAYLRTREYRGDVFLLIVTAACLALTGVGYSDNSPLTTAAFQAYIQVTIHLACVVIITILYRLSPFHPLARYPGPLINKITSFRLAYFVSTGKKHLIIEGLHQKYGMIVRTAPNTLSVNTHSAVSTIYSSATSWNKSEAYRPGRIRDGSLFFIRDRTRHNNRRRVWGGAFSIKALNNANSLMKRRTQQLLNVLTQRSEAEGTQDMVKHIRHSTFDLMVDLTFGGSSRSDLVSEGDPHNYIEGGQRAMVAFEVLGEVPSVFDVCHYLPLTDDLHGLKRLAESFIQTRKTVVSKEETDLSSYLLGHHDESSEVISDEDLNMDAVFAMEAGSETAAGVLIFLLWYIISDREIYDKLTAELDQHFAAGEVALNQINGLVKLSYLNAVVNEGLRLGTPFPGLPRITPKGGAIFEDNYIPEGTIVGVPAYSQHINPENYWPAPLEFKPERWMEGGLGPDSICKPAAIMSFSYGPFGCLGKQLAIRELHFIIAELLLNFHITFPDDFDRQGFHDGVLNMRTTIYTRPLLCNLSPRTR